MNIVMNHAPGAGSIARPVDLQFNVLPLIHSFPANQMNMKQLNMKQLNNMKQVNMKQLNKYETIEYGTIK